MVSAFTTAGKKALLDGVVGNTWKAALYTAGAKLSSVTKAYTTSGEVSSGGYETGGQTLEGARTGVGDDTAWMDFEDVTWPGATFTTRYMLIYDASDDNRAYAVIDFGSDKTGEGGDFTFQMPVADAGNAIIRI